MHKFLILFFLLPIPLIFSADQNEIKSVITNNDIPDEKLHKKCIYPTVKISDDLERSGGTGFIVKSVKMGNQWHNTMISAAHVVIGEDSLWVHVGQYKNWSELVSYKKYRMLVYAHEIKYDICVCHFISDEEMPVANMCFNSKKYINTEVFHCGYALLDDIKIDHGQITQPITIKPEHWQGTIRTNCFTYMGDSGGPLFLKSNHEVIGVCSGIRNYNGKSHLPHMSYYRPIDCIKTLNTQLNNALEFVYNKEVPQPVLPFIKLKLNEFEVPDDFIEENEEE